MKIIVDRMPRTGGDCIFAKPAPFGLKYVCNITTDSNPRCKLDCEGACPYLVHIQPRLTICDESEIDKHREKDEQKVYDLLGKKWRSSSWIGE